MWGYNAATISGNWKLHIHAVKLKGISITCSRVAKVRRTLLKNRDFIVSKNQSGDLKTVTW
jgi:hypothetical protein